MWTLEREVFQGEFQCCGSGSGSSISMMNPDPDTDRFQCFWWLKIERNNSWKIFLLFFWSKIEIYLSLGLSKGSWVKERRGSGRCLTFPICLWPRRSMFLFLLILLSSLILCNSVTLSTERGGGGLQFSVWSVNGFCNGLRVSGICIYSRVVDPY